MSQPAEDKKFHRKRGGFRLFGLNRQDLIRYFFGGNASFAILILALICVFLFLEGKNFLPEYHQSLQIARGSGIDLHDAVDKQYGDIKRFIPGFIRAFSTESTYPGRHEADLALAHSSLRQYAEKFTRRDRSILSDLQKSIEKVKADAAKSAGPAGEDTGPEAFAIDPAQVESFTTALDAFTAELQSLPPPAATSDEIKAKRMALLRTLFETRKPAKVFDPPAAAADKTESSTEHPAPTLEKLLSVEAKLLARIESTTRAALDDVEKSDILEAREISEEEFAQIVANVRTQAGNPKARDSDFPLYQQFEARKSELNATATHAKPLQETFMALNEAKQPLEELSTFIREYAVDTKTRAETAASLVKRIRGPYRIYSLREEPRIRADKLAMMLRECSIAEFFSPGARLYYIAALDTIIQDELATFTRAVNRDTEEKSKAFTAASDELVKALADPSDLDALRDAYETFENAADEALAAFLLLKSPAEHYAGFFNSSEGKAAFASLEGHLETISAAVPGYREKFAAGTFGPSELSAFEAAAGKVGSGKIDPKLAAQLLDAASNFPDDPESFAGTLTELAPEFQLPFPYGETAQPLYEAAKKHGPIVEALKAKIAAAVAAAPDASELESPYAAREIAEMRENLDSFFAGLDSFSAEITGWKHDHEQTALGTLGAFVGGSKWTNNSAIQNRYGLLPLFTGSFIISIIAISLAVPVGISAAVYVNQIAGPRQQAFLKPIIEFIGTIPSIVLGFLGIAVLSGWLKSMSETALLDWLPGLPITSRLNMLTAALLLFFMAIPTIFSLAEDALNNVPGYLRQGSLALGATNLQTAFQVVLPAATSGIIAAVLLGFGRVIGETMVVLLVAGNRIALPDTQPAIEWVGMHPATSWALLIGSVCAVVLGILVRVKKRHLGGPVAVLASVFSFFPFAAVAFLILSFATQPTHTMTGIIAQSLGEASPDSTSWQALFMVGLVLFAISLVINYVAQKVVNSYSLESRIKKKGKPTNQTPPTDQDPAGAVGATT